MLATFLCNFSVGNALVTNVVDIVNSSALLNFYVYLLRYLIATPVTQVSFCMLYEYQFGTRRI